MKKFPIKHHLCLGLLTIGLAISACVFEQKQNPYPAPNKLPDADEVLIRGQCPPNAKPYHHNRDVTAPDGRTFLCLTNLLSEDIDWRFSPDGQYLLLIIQFTHAYRYRLFQISTAKEICSNQLNEGRREQPPTCPILKLPDGRWWWADYYGIFLKTGAPNIWSLVNSSTESSPDGDWIIGESGGWYLARVDGKIVTRYSMPYPYSPNASAPCGWSFRFLVWRSDSKQFAVIQPGDKNVFVWSIQEDGSVRLDNQVVLEKCPYSLRLTLDGKVITTSPYP